MERQREKEVIKRRLKAYDVLIIARMVEEVLQSYNGNREIGADRLDALLDRQVYRLAGWRVAAEINYRRFFDINDLAAYGPKPRVFAHTRACVPVLQEGKVTGLRIDHPDGSGTPLTTLTVWYIIL